MKATTADLETSGRPFKMAYFDELATRLAIAGALVHPERHIKIQTILEYPHTALTESLITGNTLCFYVRIHGSAS